MFGRRTLGYQELREFAWINDAYRQHFAMHGIQKIVQKDNMLAALTKSGTVVNFARVACVNHWVEALLPPGITGRMVDFVSLLECDWPHDLWPLASEYRVDTLAKEEAKDADNILVAF